MKFKKYNYYKYLYAVLFFTVATATQASGQLTVTVNQTAAVLSSTLAGPGITILNPTLTCPTVANATFTSVGTLLNMSGGVILTNGHAAACVGPYGAPPGTASFNDGAAGDPTMVPFEPPTTPTADTTTYDACMLQFDMIAAGDSIGFNYQFGSQEYYHSTCGTYSDIFGFFISGPGIAGAPNIALVPGTNIPVEVNSVNGGVAGGVGGVYGGDNIANCNSLGAGSPFSGAAYYINNAGGTQLSYVGYTTKFRAVHAVTPCDTYHLKLCIVDVGNADYDSGVFLQANSLTPPTIAAPPAICVGGATTLSAPLAGGTWSSGSTAIATIGATSGTATGVSGGTAIMSYTFGASCVLTTSLTVTALAPVTGNPLICLGGTTTLSNASAGGTWSSSNTTVATINTTSGFITSLSIGTTTITYTLPSGCQATAIVNVNPGPAAITGSPSVCIGYTVTLNDATSGGAWTCSNTSIATVSPAGVVSGISAGAATITYTSTGGCYVTAAITVNTVYTSTLNASICQGSSYTFGGSSYTTTGTYTHTFPTASCDSIVTMNLTVHLPSSTVLYDSICNGTYYTLGGINYTASGVYTYTTTNVYSCDSTVTLNLYVKPTPDVPTVVSPVTYCQGQASAQLSAGGNALIWYLTNPGGTGTGSATAPTPSTTISGTTWYYVNQTVNGCTGPMDSIEVVVSPTPTASINPGRTSICQNDTTLLAAGLVPSGSYSWTLQGTGDNIVNGTNTSQSIIIQFSALGDHQVFLTVSENGICPGSDSVTIHVYPVPVANFYVKPDICIGDTVVVALSYKSSSATNFTWDFDGATIIAANSNSGGPYSLSWLDTGIHRITLITSANLGCSTPPFYDTVNVHGLPDATFSTLNPATCLGDTVTFSATTNDYSDIYTWTPIHFFDWGAQPLSNNGATIMGIVQVAGDVTLTVTDPFGCAATSSVSYDPQSCCTLTFPNAFSPNGDGKDDIFRPITMGNHTIHKFIVTNRWGQTVFETGQEHTGWDGTFNGVPQDIGVYFYYIKYDCNGTAFEEKGDVTLVR